MCKNKLLSIFSIVIMFTLVIAITNMPNTSSSPPTILLIEPSSIINPSLAPGTTFVINVSVIDVTDLATWQVKIQFNPSVLNCIKAWYPADNVFKGKRTVPVEPKIDNKLGYLLYGCTLLAGETGFTGSGTLCQIEFKVLSRGYSFINFTDSRTTYLLNSNDQKIKVEIQNGYFDNREALPTYTLTITSTAGGTTDPPPGSHSYTQGTVVSVTAIPNAGFQLYYWELDGVNVGAQNPITVTMNTDHTLNAVFMAVGAILYIDPPKIIDPTMVPSSTFKINITIDDVANMRVCEFNFTYDTNIISWVTLEVCVVQNQIPTSKTISDDEAGYVWVKLKYPSSITTDSPLVLARITLHVDAMGATPLNLTNTKITDPADQPISHTAIGGFFATLIQDLAITNVIPSTNWVYQGRLVYINVTAKNLGNQPESFNVKLYYDTWLIGTQYVTALSPDAEVTLSFAWNTSLVEPGIAYSITAEATILPYETNTYDNIYIDGTVMVRFLGDIDGSNSVDMMDLREIAQAFASYPGHPRWNPDADLNEDNYIDMIDLRLAAKNFGKGRS